MLNSKPKISVIIPAYNIEKYISRCIDSVIEQTYDNLEIIVVDDGSTDGTWNEILAQSKKDGRIIPIHQENSGVSKARLTGINRASGDCIGFVDGDDRIDPDMYELLVEKLIQNDCDISHCGYKKIFPDGRIDYYYNTKNVEIQDHLTGVSDLIEGKKIEPGLWNKLFKKSLFTKLFSSGKMDFSIRLNEDLLMNYFLFSYANKSVFTDDCKYHYIVRENSASAAPFRKEKFFDCLKVHQIIFDETKSTTELHDKALVKYVSFLIIQMNSKIPKELKKKICVLLKEQAGTVFSSNVLSKKIKLIVFGIVYLTPIYVLTRKIYEKFRDK